MRLPRMQLTVRLMVVAVGVIAVLLGAERTWQRFSFCRERVTHHANQEKGYRLEAQALELTAGSARKWGQAALAKKSGDEARYYRSEEVHHANLKREYQRVASRPWLPLPPPGRP